MAASSLATAAGRDRTTSRRIRRAALVFPSPGHANSGGGGGAS